MIRWTPVRVTMGLVLFSFGFPLMLGHIWHPLPAGWPLGENARAMLGQPFYLPALDTFSFANVDWPWRLFAREQLLQGRFPLWNPFASLGLPFIPQYQNQLLFPIEWLEVIGGPASWGFFLILKIWLAIFGAYRLASLFVEDELEKGYVCLAYAFSAFFVWFHTVPAFVNGAMMVPWLLWSIVRLSKRETDYLCAIGIIGATSGLSWLSGQPQIAALSHLAAVIWVLLYSALRVLYCKGSEGRCALLLMAGTGLGCVAGILIASPQIALFIQAMSHGYSLHSPDAYAGAGTAPMNLSLTVFPFLLGQLMWPWNSALFPAKLNAEAFPFFIGVGGFLLFIAGTTALLKKSRLLLADSDAGKEEMLSIWALLILSALIVGLIVLAMFGIEIWSGPLIGRINLPRYCTPILSLCMVLVGAYGLGRFSSLALPHRRIIIAATIMVMLALLGLASAGFQDIDSDSVIDTKYQKGSLFVGLVTPVVVLLSMVFCARRYATERSNSRALTWALIICSAAELLSVVRYGFSLEDEVRRAASTAYICFAAILIMFRFHKIAGLAGVCGLVSLATIFILADFKLSKSYNPYATTPAHIRFLKEQVGTQSMSGRVLASQAAMVPNVANAFGIAELASLNPMQIESTAFYLLEMLASKKLDYTTPNAWPGVANGESYPSWKDYAERRKYYNLLGVRYLVDTPTGELLKLSIKGLREVFRDQNVHILEDPNALPRLYVASSVYAAPDAKAAREYMQRSEFDPSRLAVIESPSELIPHSLTNDGSEQVQPIKPDFVASNKLRFTYSGERPVLFVQTDAYYPGWHATVNGSEVPIYRINGVFKGVILEPGRSVVEIHYSPRYFLRSNIQYQFQFSADYFHWILAMSLIALVGISLIVLWKCRRNIGRRHAKQAFPN